MDTLALENEIRFFCGSVFSSDPEPSCRCGFPLTWLFRHLHHLPLLSHWVLSTVWDLWVFRWRQRHPSARSSGQKECEHGSSRSSANVPSPPFRPTALGNAACPNCRDHREASTQGPSYPHRGDVVLQSVRASHGWLVAIRATPADAVLLSSRPCGEVNQTGSAVSRRTTMVNHYVTVKRLENHWIVLPILQRDLLPARQRTSRFKLVKFTTARAALCAGRGGCSVSSPQRRSLILSLNFGAIRQVEVIDPIRADRSGGGVLVNWGDEKWALRCVGGNADTILWLRPRCRTVNTAPNSLPAPCRSTMLPQPGAIVWSAHRAGVR